MRGPPASESFAGNGGAVPRFLQCSLLLTRCMGAPSGKRHSSQIIERVKNPKNTFVQSNFHGKPFRNSDASGEVESHQGSDRTRAYGSSTYANRRILNDSTHPRGSDEPPGSDTVVSPSGDIDVVPVREITQFQSKSESLSPNAPRPLTGECSRVFGPEAEEERSSSTW
jgi:hypothetical protein